MMWHDQYCVLGEPGGSSAGSDTFEHLRSSLDSLLQYLSDLYASNQGSVEECFGLVVVEVRRNRTH